MSTAAIAIDDWKFPIFEKILKGNGYKFEQEQGTGVFSKCIILSVDSENMPELHDLIKEANAKATKNKIR